MSAAEKMDDKSRSDAIDSALHATGVIPVLPLVQIIIRYTLPFRSVVTTLPISPPCKLKRPLALCVWPRASAAVAGVDDGGTASTNGDNDFTLIVSDDESVWFKLLRVTDAKTSPTAAAWVDFVPVPLGRAWAICLDPLNPNRIYLACSQLVCVYDCSKPGVVTSVADASRWYGRGDSDTGAGKAGCPNQSDVELNGILCTQNGAAVILLDGGMNRVRQIDLASARVTTIAGPARGLREPSGLVFDRTTAKPESVVFTSAHEKIMRVELDTGAVQAIEIIGMPSPRPHGIACTRNGRILFTTWTTNSLYSLDPRTRRAELLAGSDEMGESGAGYTNGSALSEARFRKPDNLVVEDVTQCLYVADVGNDCIRRVTLSTEFFGEK